MSSTTPISLPDRWDMRTIIERVAAQGDLFAAVSSATPQELPPISLTGQPATQRDR